MANNDLIQVRVDGELKRQADALFQNLGMDTPTAIRVFLKQSISRRGMPFPIVEPDGFYGEENMAWLRKTAKGTGKPIVKTMEELEAMADE